MPCGLGRCSVDRTAPRYPAGCLPRRGHVDGEPAVRTPLEDVGLAGVGVDEEEEVAARLILNALAEVCSIEARLDLGLLPGEQVRDVTLDA